MRRSASTPSNNALRLGLVAALLSGCAGTQLQPLQPVSSDPAAHADRGKSWMSPAAKKSSALLYVSDWETNDVNVYDLLTGKQVGQLTGFNAPYGQCVDAKGDVYITNYTNGQVFEYAHGGKKVLNIYASGGYPIGCALDAKGDLAVTNYVTPSGPGNICVWKDGSGSASCYSDGTSCYFLSPAGYDDKGNLVAVGRVSKYTVSVCAVLSGASSMTTLSYNGTLRYPGGAVTWDGKYLLLPETVNEYRNTTFAQATLSGSTLTYVGDTTIGCTGSDESVYVTMPFVVGKKNTPVNEKQGNIILGGGEVYCPSDGPLIGLWHYPAGGDPYKVLNVGYAYGLSVSLAK